MNLNKRSLTEPEVRSWIREFLPVSDHDTMSERGVRCATIVSLSKLICMHAHPGCVTILSLSKLICMHAHPARHGLANM